MTKADTYYQETLKELLEIGIPNSYKARTTLSDGSTINYRSLPDVKLFTYDLSKGEFPLTTVRPVAWKSAIKEILWIFQDRSNKVSDLDKKYGVKWWWAWADERGTIGRSYGWQIQNRYRRVNIDGVMTPLNQIDWLIWKLKNSPDRRMIMSMFDPERENAKQLQECAYETIWRVVGDELHMTLVQRSSDFAVAGVINAIQYSALLMMVAHETGYKVGKFNHFISDLHLYDNQAEQAELIISRTANDNKALLQMNATGKGFYDITIDDFEVKDYSPQEQIKFGELAL